MKMNLLAAFATLGVTLSSAASEELTWFTDFEAGKKAAAESGKTLLVDFTGSDWCPPCIQLKKEVFDQEAFQAAADKYVLVELDFPQAEDTITPEQRGKNEELAQNLGVDGLPTVILFDAEARPFARTGYQEGGPEAYLKHLDEISEPFLALQKAEGEGRKEALVTFLKTLAPENIDDHFAAEFEELKTLDPEDETGLVAELAAGKAMVGFEKAVEESLVAGDFAAVLKLVEDFIAEHQPEGESKQHVMMARVMVHVEQGEKDKAFATIDEMATYAPESEFSQNVEEIKMSITEHLEMRAEMEKQAAEEEGALPEEPSVVEEAEAAETEEEIEEERTNPAPIVE